MSCEVVQPAVNSNLATKIVEELQSLFASKVYLDKIYPIALVGTQQLEDRVHTFPRVYLNDGGKDYIDVMPDDKLKGYTFFEIEGIESYNRLEEEFTMTLNQIFWFNQNKIDDRNYDYTHELIADILKTYELNSNITEEIQIEENIENIYNKYDLPQERVQHLMYPFTGVKFTFTVTICESLECIPEFTLISSPSDC
jgi:hypothetical protein